MFEVDGGGYDDELSGEAQRFLQIGPGGIIKQEFPKDRGECHWPSIPVGHLAVLIVTPDDYKIITGRDACPPKPQLPNHERAVRLGRQSKDWGYKSRDVYPLLSMNNDFRRKRLSWESI